MKSSSVSAILLLFLVFIAAGSVSAQCPKTLYHAGPVCKDDQCTSKCKLAYGANSDHGECFLYQAGDFLCICKLIDCN